MSSRAWVLLAVITCSFIIPNSGFQTFAAELGDGHNMPMVSLGDRNAQLKFNAGLMTSLDFTTIKNNYAKAQSDLLRAKYQYIFKLKVLDFYQGKPLTLQ